jgi:hypothetical protein
MRRRGITLTEVLVAVFVVSLGMIALMTLFPLGAFSMAQAIQDDRAAQCAANGASTLRMVWRNSLNNGSNDPLLINSLKASNVVYLDPIGCLSSPIAPVGGTGGAIPRATLFDVSPSSTVPRPNYQQAVRWFTSLDDMTFDQTGSASQPGGAVFRQGLYSWAYMLRNPGPPPTSGLPRVIDYSVVVYKGRAFGTTGSALNENRFALTAAAGAGATTLSISGTPNLKRGGWVLDEGSGFFYRADSVVPGNPTVITTENPVRVPITSVVVLDNVVEVFDRSTLE